MPLPDPACVCPQADPALRERLSPCPPGECPWAPWMPPAHEDRLSPPYCSALPHLTQNFLCRWFFCITWRQDTCRTRWVLKSSHPPWLRAPFHCTSRVSMLTFPSAQVPQNSSDPVDHPVPQPAVSIHLPSYFPTSGIYLHHTDFPSRQHHWKSGFFSGKGTESRAGGTFTPPSQNLCEDPRLFLFADDHVAAGAERGHRQHRQRGCKLRLTLRVPPGHHVSSTCVPWRGKQGTWQRQGNTELTGARPDVFFHPEGGMSRMPMTFLTSSAGALPGPTPSLSIRKPFSCSCTS